MISTAPEPIVAVLAGGTSKEKEVSLRSGIATAAAAAASFPTRLIFVADDALPSALDPRRHVVLSTLHGTFGEDGGMQALLERAGFAYAGCDAASSALTMDKTRTKQVAATQGVPVADAVVFDAKAAPSSAELVAKLGAEVVLKPNNEGSSVGLRICENGEQLSAALRELRPGRWIAERRVRGIELTVGVLHGRAMGVVEIAPKSGHYDYASKYTSGASEYFVPARISAAATAAVQRHAEAAFAACGCRDFARVDFILAAGERPVMLEVNTLPGMTATSLLPKSATCAGHDFNSLVRAMAQPAIDRFHHSRLSLSHG